MNCFIVAFPNTTQAMMLQSVASREGLPGRIIPVPRNLKAGCGMAWMVPEECEQQIRDAIQRHRINTDAMEIMEYGLRSRYGKKRT